MNKQQAKMNDDLISRKALKEALKENEWITDTDGGGLENIIDNAPTVEQPTGEWILHGMIYYCSKCGHECGESGDNFCGNCGVKMKGEEDG
jgi:rubrerythrin